MRYPVHAWLLTAALAGAAHGQDAAPPRVTVTATRDPVDKSYRKMIAGMQRFEREHVLAPQATLRFELLPRLPTTRLDGITLRVAGDTLSLPVPVAPDHTFTLALNAQALKEDAALVASSKTSTLTWRARVRAGLLSNNDQLFAWLGELFTDADRVCSSPQGNYLFFSERPLFAVTLRDGARSETLPFDMLYAGGTQTPDTLPFCDCQVLLDRSFYAPLWDRGWSDDTLLELSYQDDPPGAADTVVADDHRSMQQMQAALGPASVIRFDSGYQVWRYRYPSLMPAKDGEPHYADFVILFGPDGMARKARLSERL